MRRGTLLHGLVALALALGLGACAMGERKEQPTSAATEQGSLYQRLGGQPGIEAVTGRFLEIVAADPRINGRFAKTDIPALKAKLVDQICEATGGPCKYAGKPMREAHAGMRITAAEFNAMGEDLAKALDFFGVATADKDELLKAIGSMKGDIVGV